jgi:hypothetical protein
LAEKLAVAKVAHLVDYSVAGSAAMLADRWAGHLVAQRAVS